MSSTEPLPTFRRRSREVAVSAKDRAALFGNMQKAHTEKQLANPFSEHGSNGKLPMKKLDKNDPTYGKPLQGSVTEQRGNLANSHIQKEIEQLIQIIYDIALNDPNCPGPECFVKFGPLFEYYNHISDKVVGLLLRARKHGHLTFEGEMLFQRRDDNVRITLTPQGMKLIKHHS